MKIRCVKCSKELNERELEYDKSERKFCATCWSETRRRIRLIEGYIDECKKNPLGRDE